MKTAIITTAAALLVASAASAQTATVTNMSMVGPQGNVQQGDHNFATNSSTLSTTGYVGAFGGTLSPSIADSVNVAQSGPQLNTQLGGGNFALNAADIRLTSAALANRGGVAMTTQTAGTTAQNTDQVGYYNTSVNNGRIDDRALAVAGAPFKPVRPVLLAPGAPIVGCATASCLRTAR